MSKLPQFPPMGLFKMRIGVIRFYDCLAMGLMPDCLNGGFKEKNIELLHEKCRIQPELHIASSIPEKYMNRLVPGAQFYYLCKGDSAPNLECDVQALTLEFFERVRDDVLAVPPEKRRGIDRFGLAWAEAVISGANALDPKVITGLACKDAHEDPRDIQTSKKWLA